MSDTLLTKEEVAELTGRKTKAKQIEQLRKMGLPFWINPVSASIIPPSAIEGKTPADDVKKEKIIPRLFRDVPPRENS